MAKGLPYLLPRADKTVSHKLGGLKKKKELYSLIVVEIRSPKINTLGLVPSRGSQEESISLILQL